MNELSPGPSPRFERMEDGSVVVLDLMPDVLEVSNSLIEKAIDGLLMVQGDVMEFRLANGRWVYEIRERRAETDSVVGVICYREET